MSDSSRQGVFQADSRALLVGELRRQLERWKTAGGEDAAPFSCGAAAIDRLLPGGRLRHGMLVEWLSAQAGCGAATLSLLAAREACRAGGTLVVVDRRRTFYPPAAAAWGVDLDRLIVVRPLHPRDELWAAVQSLRSPAVAAVWAAIDRADARTLRRLQLAAEAGRTLGAFLRPARVRSEPTWAAVRLEAESREQGAGSRQTPRSLLPAPRRLVQVQLLRGHGSRAGSAVVEIDDAARQVREVVLSHEAHPVSVAAELASPTAPSCPARA